MLKSSENSRLKMYLNSYKYINYLYKEKLISATTVIFRFQKVTRTMPVNGNLTGFNVFRNFFNRKTYMIRFHFLTYHIERYINLFLILI